MTVLISKGQPQYGAITARSHHHRGVNAPFADGSVRFVRTTIDSNTWRHSARSAAAKSSAATHIDGSRGMVVG